MKPTLIFLLVLITLTIRENLALFYLNQTSTKYIVFDAGSSETDKNGGDPYRVLNILPPDAPALLPSFVSVADRSLHQDLFQKIFNLLLSDGVFFNSDKRRSESPYDYQCPTCLASLLNFNLSTNAETSTELLEHLKIILRHSPHVSHPFYLAKSGSGLDPYALAADWLGTTISSMPLTYSMGPVYTLMEMSVIQNLRRLIGYPDGGYVGGTVTPGNSVGTIMAVNLAMQNTFPNFKLNGFIGGKIPKVAIFISSHANGAFEKTQIFSGFSQESLVRIKIDTRMRMSVKALGAEIEKALLNGITPLMVVATAGTPAFGSIDPIFEIAEICQKYKIWLHVDADQAGAYLFSDKLKFRLKGIYLSDSVTWSASSILGAPHLSTFLLTKDSGACRNAFKIGAVSVYPKSELYNASYDLGDQTIQTSRRPEVIKTWFMWKAKGRHGLTAHLHRTYENLDFTIAELLSSHRTNNFQLAVNSFDTPVVSFIFIPTAMRNQSQNTTEFVTDVNTFTIRLKKLLLKSGVLQISLSKHPSQSLHFFTLPLYNSALTEADILYILDQITFYGEQLSRNGSVESLKSKLSVPNEPSNYPAFVSVPLESEHKHFYATLFELFLKKGLFFQDKRKEPAFRFRKPELLQTLIDFDLGEDGLSQVNLLQTAEKVIHYSPHYGHPAYNYQLRSGFDAYSVMADYFVSAINSPMLTYEDSPAFTLMEREVLFEIRKLLGYPNGDGDGVINDGGSLNVLHKSLRFSVDPIELGKGHPVFPFSSTLTPTGEERESAVLRSLLSNMVAMALAQYKKFPETKNGGNGVTKKEMVAYISEEAHYSFQKAAFMQGHGLANCVSVKTDERGRMLVSELRKAIQTTLQEGKVPFMVAATSGTTVLGAIDPLNEIADICQEFGLWFHVDGVLGGALIMSEKYRPRLTGVERSDSFALNFHKMFGGASTMSVLVTRHAGIQSKALAIPNNMDFVSPDNGFYDRTEFDVGDKQIQGTKRANILKIWFLWKAKGTAGLGAHVDYIFDRASTLKSEILSYGPAFELVIPEFELTNTCFYYIPKRLRGVEKNQTYFEELDKIAPQLNKILVERELLNFVAQTRRPGDIMFMKLPILSSGITDEDVKYFVKLIDFYGKDL